MIPVHAPPVKIGVEGIIITAIVIGIIMEPSHPGRPVVILRTIKIIIGNITILPFSILYVRSRNLFVGKCIPSHYEILIKINSIIRRYIVLLISISLLTVHSGRSRFNFTGCNFSYLLCFSCNRLITGSIIQIIVTGGKMGSG